jgi:hypothetical protein
LTRDLNGNVQRTSDYFPSQKASQDRGLHGLPVKLKLAAGDGHDQLPDFSSLTRVRWRRTRSNDFERSGGI